ncbi:HAD hydrolase-like protein [Agreia sp. COWG]|uniref:HAD hydrolase-like protein n=1 Tax=Agreia sp. COWG TaxID=2773266 RepID=UPI00192732AA|nr:HAD hydrolase-like protein [Agreia sp. COWG]CAD5989223.1 Phosphoglycolate phosphatase [Agreia sp. COWG]
MTSHAASKPWSTILFDLDGTITDSAPGILHRLARTLEILGHPVPPPSELVKFVGPPILDGFRAVADMDAAGAQDALVVYRGLAASDGPQADSVVYDGALDLLRSLHAAGVPIAITTSKSEVQAVRILQHLGVDGLFATITGSSEDETRSAKADVVEEALVRLRAAGVDLSNTVLVGDRHHDIEGAAVHGIPTIMVEWGYGSPAEAAGAIDSVSTMQQLAALLL